MLGAIVQVVFGGERGRPIAVSKKMKMKGRRVLVKVDDFDPLASESVFILHHAEIPDLIIAASTQHEAIKRVLGHLAAGTHVYEITCVPVLDTED